MINEQWTEHIKKHQPEYITEQGKLLWISNHCNHYPFYVLRDKDGEFVGFSDSKGIKPKE